MLRVLFFLAVVFCLSCSSDLPTAQNKDAATQAVAPWETVEINGATYRRVAAKPTASQEDVLISILIPVTITSNGDLVYSDTVVIGDRVYTANCNTGNTPNPGVTPSTSDDVGNTRSTALPLTVNYPPVGSSDLELTTYPSYELTAGDVDYFRIRINREADMAVMSLGTTDTVGSLHLSDGTLLQRDDDGMRSESDPNNRNFFLLGGVLDHTYYLKVTGTGSKPTGIYTLAIGIWNKASAKPVASEEGQRKMVMIEKVKDLPW